MSSCKECVPRCLDERMAAKKEKMVRAPERPYQKKRAPPYTQVIQVFFQGSGWYVETRLDMPTCKRGQPP